MSPDAPQPYRVTLSGRVFDKVRELAAVAAARGDGEAFLAALREFDHRLRVYPQFGDPLVDRWEEVGQIRIGIVPPLAMRYAVFEERRDMVVATLNTAKGVNCLKPDGAFYVYPSIHGCIGKTSKGGKFIKDDEAFVLALLDEEGVATVHGAAFCFPGYIRISYANSTAELQEAMTRILRFCEGLH